jgi:hypothetical protein
MSSDRTGAVGEAAIAAEPATGTAAADSGSTDRASEDAAQLTDPWFGPGPKVDGTDDVAPVGAGLADLGPVGADTDGGQAEWFLRTGRAGLLPDSMTVALNDDNAASTHAEHEVRTRAAGAPPWAGETAPVAGAPPPWETGPWPGPGGVRSPGSGAPGGGRDDAAALAADVSASASGSGGASGRDTANGDAAQGRWSGRTVVTAGLMPFVVPGLVLGILSLRQAAGRSVRRASWLAIGASIAWAVIIILIVVGTSSGPAGSCAGYPAAVHQAYAKALADLTDHAPVSVQAADLDTAASRANASAAAAGQIGVRTALFAMANDMAQARADVLAHRPVPATLRQHLSDDGAAPTGSCTA